MTREGELELGGTLILAGCGKMGAALLDGWLARGASASSIIIAEPNGGSAAPFAARGVTHVSSLEDLGQTPPPAVMVLALKPQLMEGNGFSPVLCADESCKRCNTRG